MVCYNVFVLTRIQASIKILKEASLDFFSFLQKVKKEERELVAEINKKKDEEEIKRIKDKLGI